MWDYKNSTGTGADVSLKDFRKDIVIELYNAAGHWVGFLGKIPWGFYGDDEWEGRKPTAIFEFPADEMNMREYFGKLSASFCINLGNL